MLIQDLDCLEFVPGSDVVGGIRPGKSLLLRYQNGTLSIKLGEKVLFEGVVDVPNLITLKLGDVPKLYTSGKTESINGFTQSTVIISTEPISQSSVATPFF